MRAFDGKQWEIPTYPGRDVRRLLEQLITDRNSVRGHIGDVCALVRGTPCFALRVGDPQATAAAVREVLHDLAAEPAASPFETLAG